MTQAKSEGINNFVFNVKLPVHKKSNLLQKTKDEQVKYLANCKNVFSTGAMWMTLGFKLMCACATIQAQVQLLDDKAAAVMEVEEKRPKNFCLNFEKADASLHSYKSGVS